MDRHGQLGSHGQGFFPTGGGAIVFHSMLLFPPLPWYRRLWRWIKRLWSE